MPQPPTHWTVLFTKDMYKFLDPAQSKPAEISELVVLHNEHVARSAYCGGGASDDKLGMVVVLVVASSHVLLFGGSLLFMFLFLFLG